MNKVLCWVTLETREGVEWDSMLTTEGSHTRGVGILQIMQGKATRSTFCYNFKVIYKGEHDKIEK